MLFRSGGVDGLVHVSELSWKHINHPSEVVEVDQEAVSRPQSFSSQDPFFPPAEETLNRQPDRQNQEKQDHRRGGGITLTETGRNASRGLSETCCVNQVT